MDPSVHGRSTPSVLTLLFTDIEGSTSLWVEHPDDAGAAVGLHDEILARAIGAHRGSVIKTTGDGFLASFPSVRAGVEAAVDAQLALIEHSAELLGADRVRMGLHSGRVEERSGDLFGLAVNKCERIMAAGAAGQILLSTAAASALREDRPPDVDLLELGDQRLRGIPEVERVYQLIHPDLRHEFPQLATAATPATNLPVELTSFVGRATELADVQALLRTNRLVTITGEGGAGKTRLAIQVGSAATGDHQGGVWFIELDSLRDGALVAERIASTLGIEERAGRSYEELVAAHLRDRRVMLILDNCEHLLDASAQTVEHLLKAAPGLTVLATSRQRLGVSSEVDYRIPPMTVPESGAGLAGVAELDAVQLFVDRAKLSRPTFELTPANADAVSRIVRQLDGLPLALELAAAKTTALTPAQIADHLDDRFRLLTAGSRTVMPRHRTLEAAIGWSHELLSESERNLFAGLAVFRGGFDLAAPEEVCSFDREDGDVLTDLGALVDKSLVVADVELGRYRLLESIRQYASDRLRESGKLEATAGRHAEYYAGFGEQAGPGLEGPDQAAWLAALETERDNMRAALEWSLEHDPLALRLVAAMWRFWLLRRRPAEGRRWLEKALETEADGTEAWRVQALLGLASLASGQGDQEAARAALVEASGLADRIGDRRAASAALAAIAVIHHKEGDLDAATESFREALLKARDASDSSQTSRVLTNLALVLEDRGEQEEAGRCASEALAVARTTGIPDLIADAMLTAGEIALNQGDDGTARSLLEGALRYGMDTGLDDITAWARSYLGKVALQSGDLKASRALLGEAIDVFRIMDSPMGTEWALRHLAVAELESGEIESARTSAAEALRLAQDFVRPDTPFVLQVAGEIAAADGNHEDAAVVLAAGRQLGASLELQLPAFETRHFESTWNQLVDELPKAELESAAARGRTLTIDDAVDLAQRVLSRPAAADQYA